MDRRKLLDIIHGKDQSPSAQLTRVGLHAVQPFYSLAVAARNTLFDLKLRRPRQLPRPTISIGNITTGGTGKTPMTLELARRLIALGEKPAILLRGYRAADAPVTHGAISDEAALLQHALGDEVPVMPNPNRVAGARAVLAGRSDVSVFLLDDGFQHRQVHRDLDLVLIDATFPFGGGQMLPAGLLREPPRALGRAEALILTRTDLVKPEVIAAIQARLARLKAPPLTARTAQTWTGLIDAQERTHRLESLRDTTVAAVCGIGNPAQFKAMLAACFPHVTGLYELEDHQRYTPALVRQMIDHAARQGATALITTEKDWVKWKPLVSESPPAMPLYRPVLAVKFLEGEAKVDELLRAALSAGRKRMGTN
ncbi:MAG: tetraacyldisaccharide 4'-kinase [Phycisphaeraceae bacterium]